MDRVVLAAAGHDVPVRAQCHRHQGALPLQFLAKLPSGCAEEGHSTVTGGRQLPRAGPGDRADGAGMVIGAPSFATVRVIGANLPGAGGREPLAIRRPGHVVHPTGADLDGLFGPTFGNPPDKDSSVLASGSEPVSAWVDRHCEHAAVVRPLPRPGVCAGLAVERVDAARGVGNHQRLTAAGPPPGDGVVVDRRRPAPAKHSLRGFDVQIKHASNPWRMLCSSRSRPMKTS